MELPLHGINHGTVVVTGLRICLLLYLDHDQVLIIVPTLVNDHVREDPLLDAATIIF